MSYSVILDRYLFIPVLTDAVVVEAGQTSARASLKLPAVSVSTVTTRDALSFAASSTLVREVTFCSEHPISTAFKLVIVLVTSKAFVVLYFSLPSVSMIMTSLRFFVISAHLVESALPSPVSVLASSVFTLFR